jgi:predicted amidohydrolase
MLFLPECFGFIGMSSEETLKNAEPPIMEDTSKNVKSVQEYLARIVSQPSESPAEPICQVDGAGTISLLDGLRTIAKESGLWISAGGMHEAGAPVADADCDDKSERVYNSHVVLDSDGIIKALYRKIHLFDVSIPGKVSLRESSTTAPGSKLVVCDSPIGKLGREKSKSN